MFGQLFQNLEAGAFVPFSKENIETDYGHLIAVKQLIQQQGKLITAPRPSTHLGETFFIDVDNHDAVVQQAGHSQIQPQVIGQIFNVVDQFDGVTDMKKKEQNNQQIDDD